LYTVRDARGPAAQDLFLVQTTRGGQMAGVTYFNQNAWLTLWAPQDPKIVRDVRLGDPPTILRLSPDERWWAVGLRNGGVLLVPRAGEARAVSSARLRAPVTALAFTPSSGRLLVADEAGNLAVTDLMGDTLGRARLPLDQANRIWISADEGEVRVDTRRDMRVRFRLRG
jgi:hypothetical protein